MREDFGIQTRAGGVVPEDAEVALDPVFPGLFVLATLGASITGVGVGCGASPGPSRWHHVTRYSAHHPSIYHNSNITTRLNCNCSGCLHVLHFLVFMALDLRAKLDLHRKEKFLCDVNLCVNGGSFPAHKFVLAASCDYFNNLFLASAKPISTETTKTDNSTECCDVVLDGFVGTDFNPILQFLYTGQLDCTTDNVLDVLRNARKMDIVDIVDKCVTFLCQNLTVDKVLNTYQVAKENHHYSLFSACEQFAIEHFQSLMEQPDFLDIHVHLLKRLLAADGLTVRNELMVLRSIGNWLCHNFENREPHLRSILLLLRGPQVPTVLFTRELERWESERARDAVSSYLDKNCGYDVLLTVPISDDMDRDSWLCTQHTKRTYNRERMYVVGGVSGYRDTIVDWVDEYDTFVERWACGNSRPLRPRSGHALTALVDRMFLIGKHVYTFPS